MHSPNSLIKQVKDLFKTIDESTHAFCQTSGLHCKAQCGACCQKPDIQTTVTEVLPLAQWLIDNKKDEDALKAIEQNNQTGICVFYQPSLEISSNGRCGVYDNRPGICRLFAFAAIKDKHNQPQLVTCKVIKENFPAQVAKTEQLIKEGIEVPLLSNHTLQVLAIDPQNGNTFLSINAAVKKAIEHLGFLKKFENGSN